MAARRWGWSRLCAAFLLPLVLGAACATHLRQAKAAYAEAQELSRMYQTEQAIAAFKRSLIESEEEARRRASAQAYTLKGMAEVNLGLWREAELSFLKASGLGFESGEAWAADVSVLGLASSLEELGFGEPARRAYENLLGRSLFKPVRLAAAQKYLDLELARTLGLTDKDKSRALSDLAGAIEKLQKGDFACGYYHYMGSQVDSHRGDLRRSYEEAVMARELGLPSEKVFRDNDNQIVFCHDRLVGALPPSEREAFSAAHAAWAKRWGWKDARTPGWKQE